MQRRADAMTQSVRELLNSAIAAQARPGDSLGFWTFNEELYTGVLPLQQWSVGSQAATVDRIAGFLKAQKFEKHARFDKVVPAVNRVARNSQFITIMLVCSGEADIHGTPFDARINEFFRTWRLQPQDAGTPFIIALRAQSGGFVDCTMNPSPWPPELPALSKELLTPIRPVQPAIVAAQKPVTSTVPPLIISGKKREPTPNAPPADSAPGKPRVAAPPPATNSAASAQAATPVPQPTPSPTTTALKEQAAPSTNAVVVSDLAPVPAASVSSDPHIAGPVAPVPSTAPRDPAAPAAGPGASPRGPEPTPQPQDHRDAPAAAPRGPVQVAVSVPVNRSVYHATLIFMGVVSFLAIAGAVWLWRARGRRTNESSLITESLDRDKD